MSKNHQDLSSRIEKFLRSDSKSRFVKLLQDHPSEVTNSLVDESVDHGAKKCLYALLRGEVCDQFPALDNAELPESGVTCLAYVAHSDPNPEIINLMLTRCGAIPLANVSCTIGLVHGLPIHFLLVNMSYLEHIYHWKPDKSLIKLVILLCLWETKPILDCVRLLAQHTNSINDIAWTFLKNGGLEQFVALLLVARDKVLAPFDSGLAIQQCITSEIGALSKGDISIEEEEYKCILKDARKLLDVFERAGEDLSLYCSSMQDKVSVENNLADLCGLLKKSGVHVTHWDLSGYPVLKRFNLSGPHDGSSLHIEATPRPSRPSNFNPYFGGGGPCGRVPMAVPNLASLGLQSRLYSTTACNARSLRAGAGTLPRQLAYFTMKLTKAFKFL